MKTRKTKESVDFCFRRDELLNNTTERAEWGVGGRSENERRHNRLERLNAAFDVVNGKIKKAATKITLSRDEAEMIRQALADYTRVDEAFVNAGIHARALLDVIDEAGKLYREGARSAAAKTLAWTTGKRGTTEDHNSIVATYLLHVGCGRSKDQALDFVVRHFRLTSRTAAIQILKRNKKRLPSLPLPNTWPDNYDCPDPDAD